MRNCVLTVRQEVCRKITIFFMHKQETMMCRALSQLEHVFWACHLGCRDTTVGLLHSHASAVMSLVSKIFKACMERAHGSWPYHMQKGPALHYCPADGQS
jgi:hypothetical protein